MWQVVEKPGVQGSEGTYCAYGSSDFAILKLDMKVADVLPQADNTVTGTYSGVQCDIMVKPTGGSDTQVVTFVNEGASSTTFTKYNGIELVNNPTTARKTTSIVHCKFSRTLSVPTTTTTSITAIDCSHTITITDCDKPELTPGAQWGVCGNKCAGDSAPGLAHRR
ncbi:unnamed protein product [Phytophthora fragariaefolia]|uniref:Unnamed protein product n=1 Tax=Phytophthora fragariaefolia TaxID=1490495 RepID=A0A9W7DA48_9STRA|nr:unnamed protein product [Phytophthora fragariaefolia]